MTNGIFGELRDVEIYALLTDPSNEHPTWPANNVQEGYTGTNQIATLRQALGYLKLLETDGAFVDGWRGLDYACGWGRFASAMLKYGTPEQLDLIDAWPQTINIIKELNYKNKISIVSELLQDGELADDTYDFVLSFSLFTHLNKQPFDHNLKMLAKCLKPAGRVYFTVRHDNFFDHKFSGNADEYRKELIDNDGFWYRDSGGALGEKTHFGDSVVTKDYLDGIDTENLKFRYLGAHAALQQMYVMEKK